MAKKKKSKKELAGATLSRIRKEMARPRFAESARREEEDANHRTMKHDHVLLPTDLGRHGLAHASEPHR